MERDFGGEVKGTFGDIAESDRAVISLDLDRTGGGFFGPFSPAGGPGDFDILVNEETVVLDFEETGVGGFLAFLIETRGLE